MPFHEVEYLLQLVGGKSVVIRQADGIEPKLGFVIASLNVNVRRFIAFVRIKVEPIATDTQDSGHVRLWQVRVISARMR